MADAAAPGLLPVAADRDRDRDDRRRWAARCGFAVLGIMSTLLVYGVLQVRWVGSLVVLPPSSLRPLPPFLLRSLWQPYIHSGPNSPPHRNLLDNSIRERDRCVLICRLQCSGHAPPAESAAAAI